MTTRKFLPNLLLVVFTFVSIQIDFGGKVEGLKCRICNSAVDDYCKKAPNQYCPGMGKNKLMNMTDTCSSEKSKVFYDCSLQANITQDWHDLFGFSPEFHQFLPDFAAGTGHRCLLPGQEPDPNIEPKRQGKCVVQMNQLVNSKTKKETFDACILMRVTFPRLEGIPNSEIINSPRVTRYCGYKKADYLKGKETHLSFERKKMTCSSESKQGITTEVCTCAKDKCNGGNFLKLAKLTIIFSALLILFFGEIRVKWDQLDKLK